MKKAEIALIAITLLALVLNLLLISGGEVLTVLSLGALAVFYMYLGFALFNVIPLRHIFRKVAYTGISTLRIIGAILTGLALSITIVGILFKFQSWSGASLNLTIGLAGLALISIVGIIRYFKSSSNYYSNIFKRVAAFGGLGLLLYFLPENTLVEIKYRNYPAYVDAFKKSTANPNDHELWKKVKKERQKIR